MTFGLLPVYLSLPFTEFFGIQYMSSMHAMYWTFSFHQLWKSLMHLRMALQANPEMKSCVVALEL